LIVVALEQLRHIGERSSSHANVDHGSDQHSYHPLKEAVGLDRKAHPVSVRPLNPVRYEDAAAVVRLIGLSCKTAEVVLSDYALRSRTNQLDVHRPAQRPLIPGTKGRSSFVVETDVVSIPA
jgi:hypothetical protein